MNQIPDINKFNGLNNVHIPLVANIKKVNQQIDELLEVVNLTSVAYKKIGGFSGGMKHPLKLRIYFFKS